METQFDFLPVVRSSDVDGDYLDPLFCVLMSSTTLTNALAPDHPQRRLPLVPDTSPTAPLPDDNPTSGRRASHSCSLTTSPSPSKSNTTVSTTPVVSKGQSTETIYYRVTNHGSVSLSFICCKTTDTVKNSTGGFRVKIQSKSGT